MNPAIVSASEVLTTGMNVGSHSSPTETIYGMNRKTSNEWLGTVPNKYTSQNMHHSWQNCRQRCVALCHMQRCQARHARIASHAVVLQGLCLACNPRSSMSTTISLPFRDQYRFSSTFTLSSPLPTYRIHSLGPAISTLAPHYKARSQHSDQLLWLNGNNPNCAKSVFYVICATLLSLIL